MKVYRGTFELRAFAIRSGPRKGQIGYTIYPDGMERLRCTNPICDEELISGVAAIVADSATERVRQDEITQIALDLALGRARRISKIKREKKR